MKTRPQLLRLINRETLFRRWVWLGVSLLFIGILTGYLVWNFVFAATYEITIDVNNNVQRVHTDAGTVGEVLREANILLDPVDRVSPALDTPVRADMTITVTKAHQLVVDINGQIQRIYTHATDPLTILQEQGIQLGRYDELYVNHRLFHAASATDKVPFHLRVVRGKPYHIYDGIQIISGLTTASRVGDVLHENNLTLFLADRISPDVDMPIYEDIEIVITRSMPVLLRVDGRELATRAAGETVNEVLNQLGFPLTGQDYSIPDESSPFVGNMAIEIVRVIETIEIQQEEIPFQTIVLHDPQMDMNEERVVQIGTPGLREARIRIRKENGYEVSRIIQETWTITEPVPQIVAQGSLSGPATPETNKP